MATGSASRRARVAGVVGIVGAAALVAGASAAGAEPSAPGAYYGRSLPVERDGFLFGVGLGSGAFAAKGASLASLGPHLSLYTGTRASDRLTLQFQLDGINAKLQNGEDKDRRVTFGLSTVGLKWHLLNTLWVKGGLGVASFTVAAVMAPGVTQSERRVQGPGAMSAIGFDLLSYGQIVFGLELIVNLGVNSEGAVTGTAFGFAGTWY